MLQDIWMAGTRTDAEAAFDAFVATYAVKYDKAAECLKKDRDPAARLLRLPGRTLETPAHVESDRKHLRDRPTQDDPIKGMPLEQDRARHGVQAGRRRAKDLASPRRPQPVAKDHSRCEVTDGREVIAKPGDLQSQTAAA
jgi:putative transposase